MKTQSQIKSLTNPQIKRLMRLRLDRAFRHSEGSALILGEKLISELRPQIKQLLTLHPQEGSIQVTLPILKKLSGTPSPQNQLAEVAIPKPSDLSTKKRVLILDRIQDPANVGALLRSALAFHFDGVLYLEGTADPFSEKALRAAKGATFKLPYNFAKEVDLPHKLYVAHTDGKVFLSVKPENSYALIVSNEGSGPTPELLEKAEAITIPTSPETESLNVAVAASIIMHHLGA
ncbi:MAG: RNA methyltransferase [Simkaniaceae bacterium]|nr:RNA methyltransferase [Simkaniaceae bacterium]